LDEERKLSLAGGGLNIAGKLKLELLTVSAASHCEV